MQTFLPYADFHRTASVLDNQRLGKQRAEALQIVNALTRKNGWRNHVAAKMWKDHIPLLMLYHDIIVGEWIRRGFKNNMPLYKPDFKATLIKPWWLGWEPFHASHRANLTRKKPDHYAQYWNANPELPYLWPSHGVKDD